MSWRKFWPQVMNENVEITKIDTVDDELEDVLHGLPLDNHMS